MTGNLNLQRSLSKLKLQSWRTTARHSGPDASLEVAFNPASIQESCTAQYEPDEGVHASGQASRFAGVHPAQLQLELVLDDTAAYWRGASRPVTSSVEHLLEVLRTMSVAPDGHGGEPHYLRLQWGRAQWMSTGTAWFDGRVSALEVDYTLFDRDAHPLRALVRLTVCADASAAPAGAGAGTPVAAGALNPGSHPGPAQPAGAAAHVGFGTGQLALKHFELAQAQVQMQVNAVPSARLRFETRADVQKGDYTSWEKDLGASAVGEMVHVADAGKKPLFAGVVIAQEVSVQQARKVLTLQVKHPAYALVRSYRSQVFKGRSDQQIVSGLFEDHRITLTGQGDKAWSAPRKDPEQMVQYRCADWAFARARLAAHGLWLAADPLTAALKVGEPAHLKTGRTHTLSAGDDTLLDAQWQHDHSAFAHSLEVGNWDDAYTKPVAAKAGKAYGLGTGGFRAAAAHEKASKWAWAYGAPLSGAQQQALGNARLTALHAMSVGGRFTLKGRLDCHLGDTLALKGFNAHLDGTDLITEVVYEYRADLPGRWQTQVSLGLPAGTEVMDRALVPPVRGPRWGIVQKGHKVVKKIAYFEVWVPDLDARHTHTVWATWTTPYAGKDRGMCFYPVQGNRVLVEFVEHDPCCPVIVNAAPNTANPAPFEPDEKRQKMGFMWKDRETKEQFEWVFDGHARELRMLIGKEGEPLRRDSLVFHQEHGVRLESDRNVSVSAGEALTLEAKKQALHVKADAGALQMTAKQDLTLKSGAGTTLTMKPQAFSLKAMKVALEAEAGGLALKGAQSSLKLDTAGVKAEGTEVAIKGQLSTEIEALKVDIKA